MEYLVSARKYRPMTFDAVVGQEALTTTLKNAVSSGKLAHAFLFCGPRGVGKTTCARIFAKTINCLTPTASGDACGECESCKAFAEGRSYNIHELDAASNNGVEHIKTLMEQTHIPPQVGKYKVFIIDEVHMLSSAAFNAFLKTLEEPPSYVIFVLATTEKNKLLPTILSRCQIYDFERMTVDNMINHLKMVAEKEGYKYEEEALRIIAEKADGGMRDALSIFDQAASYCQGNITVEKVIQDLNLLDTDNYFDITDLSLQNKVSDVMLRFNDMLSHGMDAGVIINGLVVHMRNLMMARDAQTVELMETSERYKERYKEQAKKCPMAFVVRAMQILNRCDLAYRNSSNKRLLAEIALIEVAQITQPADDPSASPQRGRRLKSLFKKILNGMSKPAVQVAGTTAVHTEPNQTAPMRREDVVSGGEFLQQQPVSAAPVRPKLKLGNIGNSFSRIMNEGKPKEEIAVEVENKDENQQFTEDDAALQWLAMCKRMQSQKAFIGLASSMKLLRPKITEYPDMEVAVPNTILMGQMNAILKRIEVTLATNLHNGNLHLTLRLAEQNEIKKPLTPAEMLKKLMDEQLQMKILVENLKLQIKR